jgi:hypothetical protein
MNDAARRRAQRHGIDEPVSVTVAQDDACHAARVVHAERRPPNDEAPLRPRLDAGCGGRADDRDLIATARQ